LKTSFFLRTLLSIVTILGIFVTLIPFFWMLSTSLKTGSEVFDLPIRWLPSVFQWQNYSLSFSRAAFDIYFNNSLITGIVVTASNLIFCSLAGYGLAKFDFPLRNFLFKFVLCTLMLPLEIILIPTFLIVQQLDLLNTLFGLMLPLVVDGFGIFMMRQFIRDIPNSLIEAARLDGCSEFGIFWRIILPNCKPALGALALLVFRDNWDQFLWPFILASKDSLKTFPLGLAQMESVDSTAYQEIMALAVVGIIPMALLFIFFQKAFVRGIALSGLKD